MFEGDLEEGELEIGQVAAAIHAIKPAAEILTSMWQEYLACKQALCNGN
jgi:enoyl-[acyl-carrier protein] reductase II